MIVLDEQLQDYGLRAAIEQWYRGAVIDITELRPGTIIKDDAIPALLRTVRQPTFVTINATDFWRRMAPDERFAIACFAIPHTRAEEIPVLLRALLTVEPFRTRRGRMGKIIRISSKLVHYYTIDSWAIQTLEWPE